MAKNCKFLAPQNQNPSGMCFCNVICWQHKNRTPPVGFLIPVQNLVHQKDGLGLSDSSGAELSNERIRVVRNKRFVSYQTVRKLLIVENV